MQVLGVCRSGLLKLDTDMKAAKSCWGRFCRLHCGFLSVVMVLTLLGVGIPSVHADSATNAPYAVVSQLCPMLDSLTQAAASVAQSDRASASTQIGVTLSLADGLLSTIRSPDIAAALGSKSKTLLNRVSRLETQIMRAQSMVENPSIKNATALRSMVQAVSSGQQLKKLLLTAASSNTVVMLSEVSKSTTVLHYPGDSACFHVAVLNRTSDPSCGGVNVSVQSLGSAATDLPIIGGPVMSSATDFCLTMGPDAEMLQVTASTCDQTNSMLIYNYGTPRNKGPALATPRNLNASANTSDLIGLTWSYGGTGALGFKIERSTVAGTWTTVGVTSTGTTIYSDAGLTGETIYYYRVRAYDAKGYSAYSNVAVGTTSAADNNEATTNNLSGLGASVSNMPPDEFNGPFVSWANLKADYGAVGNGVADDTKALQAALNNLGTNGNASVLYIPAGTYLITSTATLQSRQHVSIIGADPSTTTLVWGGASGGVLLHLDGVAYGRYDRLTFNGQGTAGVLIDQSLTGYGEGQYFDTGNEYADDVFANAEYGIRGGNYDLGAAESSVLRCQFLGNSGAGIILKNYNALDWFIWESAFADNYDGVSNTPGDGYFHVIGCLFEHSANADIDIGDMGIFSARYNTSIGSAQFLTTEFAWANGGQITIQGNTIANTISNTAINIGTMGPILLIDNVIASGSSATGPAVVQNSYNSADMVAVGNTFTVNNPLSVTGGGTPSFVNVDNQTVALSSLSITHPVPPGALPNNHRMVFDVPVDSSASVIQAAINQAAALSGQRPVVHLPQGNYAITQTLVVPANVDVQIIGDGGTSLLYWSGAPGTNAVLQLAGPSRAILRDFGILGSGNSAGIEVDNTDQSGSRVYMEQAHLTRGETANLLVDQLDNTLVELHDFYPSQTVVAPATTGIGLEVIGGPSAANGDPLGGQTTVYAGASSGNYVSFGMSNGGRLLVNDTWDEEPDISTFALVSDQSVFTADNCRMALPTGGYTAQIENLSGLVSILGSQPDQTVGMFGNGTGTVWVAGNESHGPSNNYFTNAATSTVGVFTGNRWYNPSNGSDNVADQGTASAGLVRQMLAQLRSDKPLSQPTVLPVGVTDLRLYRMFIDSSATTDIHLFR
jgi:pectate lyase-like protein